MKTDYIPSPPDPSAETKVSPAPSTNAEPYVVDVLAGFSTASAAAVGDPKAYALAQVESVNLGLRNSQISTVTLHLLGIQIIPNDYPITTDVLSRLDELFPNAKAWGADTIAAFFVGNAQNTATGWGYIPGRLTVQATYSSTAFRHEMGHNAGGSHCNTGEQSYKFGYDNGKSRTMLCGNDISYYSNPNIQDQNGLPLGNASTADMARVWRENAVRLSSYATRATPHLILSAHSQTDTSIDLSWDWSYLTPTHTLIYRWLIEAGESNRGDFKDTGLRPATTYRYHVVATDNEGHRAQSDYIWTDTKH
jgi:hypothetical protein